MPEALKPSDDPWRGRIAGVLAVTIAQVLSCDDQGRNPSQPATPGSASVSAEASTPPEVPDAQTAKQETLKAIREAYQTWSSRKLYTRKHYDFLADYNRHVFDDYMEVRSYEPLEGHLNEVWSRASHSPFFEYKSPDSKAGPSDRALLEPWKAKGDQLIERLTEAFVPRYNKYWKESPKFMKFQKDNALLFRQLRLATLDACLPLMQAQLVKDLDYDPAAKLDPEKMREGYRHRADYFSLQMSLLNYFEGVRGARKRDFDSDIGYYVYELGVSEYLRSKEYKKAYELLAEMFEELAAAKDPAAHLSGATTRD